MRYIIIGAGAVGGLIAARLHAVGRNVVLVARGETGKAIEQHGIRLASPAGTTMHGVPVHRHVGEAVIGPADAVILAVKTQDTLAVVQDLAACAPPDTRVFCAQNGLENERIALRMFCNVYGMFVFVFSASPAAGDVRCYTAPSFGVLDLGRYPNGTDDIAEQVAADLCAAGFDSAARGDVRTWKAGKLLANLGNALTASYGDSSSLPDLLEAAQGEGRACMRAVGWSFATQEEMLDRRRHLLPLKMVNGQAFPGSSSWQSLARGASVTEVDYLTGEIVLLGRLVGVPTPLNIALQSQVRQMARDHIPPGSLNPEHLRRAMGMTMQQPNS